MAIGSQYEYHFSFTGRRFEKWWEDFSLSRVTHVQKKVFRENDTTFQFSILETNTV